MFVFGPFSVDPARRVLMRHNEPVPATARAFDVLLALLERAGQTVGKDELLRTVWPDTVVEEANLSQHIFTIRKLLGQTPTEAYIATVPRRGYQFVAPVVHVPQPATPSAAVVPVRIDTALRLEIPLPPQTTLALSPTPSVAITADGSTVVFVVREGDTSRLYARRLDQFDATPIAGSEGATHPFISPDGLWVGFVAARRLWKIAIHGGAPFALCDIGDLRGATWTIDDRIVYAPGATTGLWRVPAQGGSPQAITQLDFANGERTHRWPHALPDGSGVLFTIGHAGATSFDEASLALAGFEGGDKRLVLRHATDGRCLPGAQLMWARGGAVLSAPFDSATARISGTPAIVAQGVAASATGVAHFACSATGVLVHVPGEAQTLKRVLVTVDRNGVETSRHVSGDMLEEPYWIAGGSAALVSLRQRSSDLWQYDFARGALGRLTFEGENFAGISGPADEAITFSSSSGGPSDLWVLRRDRSQPPELLVASEFDKVAGAWSPDGKRLIFTEYHPETGADLWLLDVAAGRARPFVCTRFNEYAPVFSPDAQHVAYVSDECGRPEVMVVDCPAGSGKRQISTDGGTEPVWSRDGRELFYRSGNRVMRIDLSDGLARAGIPTTLFEGDYVPGTVTRANYDVSEDAARFLMVRAGTAPPVTSLRVTVGWTHRGRAVLPWAPG